MPVAHGFVKLWDEAGNSKLQAQFTLPNGSRLHFLGHFNPAVEEFESRDATLTYSNPGALTASHNFYAKIGRGTIFIAIGGDNGPIVEGQLVQPLSPASRVVGFGSWFKNITGDISSILKQLEGTAARILNNQVLDKLKAVSNAVFEAQSNKGCMQDTRVNILAQLVQWARDTSAPSIFWLTGMAGTGKTSIASSFCKVLADEADLGGSFFCSRTAATVEQTEVRRIIPTLVSLLAGQDAAFETAVVAGLTAKPNIAELTVAIQVEQLLRKTLAKLPSRYEVPLVLVIDALDECSNSEATAEFITALFDLTQRWASAPFPVKFFVTSRPEPHIRRALFGRGDASTVLVLHDIDPEEVSSDISRYIEAKFATTPLDSTGESPPSNAAWYSSSDIATITARSDGLFIFASTAVKFILEKGHATGRAKRLRDIVDQASSPHGTTKPLDRMYALILNQALHSFETDERIDLRLLLAQLLALREPLSVRGFAELVSVSVDVLRSALETLHTVINVPPDSDVGDLRTLHASFGDFLQHRAPDTLRVDLDGGRERLLRACFGRMQARDLCFNVSRSASSYQRNPAGRPTFIPRSLEYACVQWGFHAGEVENPTRFAPNIEAVFMPKFLFWLEVVSVLRRVDDGLRALAFATSLVPSEEANRFLRHCREFITVSRDAFETSAPHIYLSVLPFAPHDSAVVTAAARLFIRLPQARVSGLRRTVATVLQGHESRVHALACSPDKRFLVSGSADKTVRIWDVLTGSRAQPAFTGYPSVVNAVAFSPDGTRVTSVSGVTLRVWNVRSRESTVIRCGWLNLAFTVAFSPDGGLLAAGLYDRSVRIWNVQTRDDKFQALRGHSDAVRSVAFSPYGRTLASASSDSTIRLWSTATGELILGPLTGHDGSIISTSFSPDGRSLASASVDHTICTWNVLTGEKHSTFRGHTGPVCSVSFSPDGTRIVSGSADRTVLVWNAETGEAIGAPLVGHADEVRAVLFLDTETAASASYDGTIRVWDLRNNQQQFAPPAAHSGGVWCVAISADGTIASGSDDGTVGIWHSGTGDQKLPPIEVGTEVNGVSFSPDGTLVAAGCSDQSIRIIDAETGRETQSLEGHHHSIQSVSFSPNGEWILSASFDNTARVWNVRTGQQVLKLEAHTDWVRSAVFSPDGTRIASGSDDCTVAVWHAGTGQLAMPLLRGHSSTVRSVCFSPDGMSVASGSSDKTIRIWQSVTGEYLRIIHGHLNLVNSVAFSPNGKWIVSGSRDKTVRLWSASDGEQLLCFNGHTNLVNSVVFTPDSSSIVSGSWDTAICVWDISSMHGTPRPPRAERQALDLRFSDLRLSDGWIVGPDGELIMWIPHDYLKWLVIGPKLVIGMASVTFEDTSHGLDWTQIYRG